MRVYTRAVPIACLLDNGMNHERLPLVVPVCGSQDNVQLMSNRAHDTDIVVVLEATYTVDLVHLYAAHRCLTLAIAC